MAPRLAAPIRVQMSSRGDVFALDGIQRRVVRFDARGESRRHLAPEGVPEPSSIVARNLKIDPNDAIYLLDAFSARVLILGGDGKDQRHLRFPGATGSSRISRRTARAPSISCTP